MTPPPDISEADISEAAASLVRRLSKTLLSLVATPAAVVTEAGRVVATNGAWEELVGFQPTSSGPPELGPEIGECLRGFDRVESLLHQLRSGSQTGAGVATLLRPLGPSIQGDSRRECVAFPPRVRCALARSRGAGPRPEVRPGRSRGSRDRRVSPRVRHQRSARHHRRSADPSDVDRREGAAVGARSASPGAAL
jgi:hypothetical protein